MKYLVTVSYIDPKQELRRLKEMVDVDIDYLYIKAPYEVIEAIKKQNRYVIPDDVDIAIDFMMPMGEV